MERGVALRSSSEARRRSVERSSHFYIVFAIFRTDTCNEIRNLLKASNHPAITRRPQAAWLHKKLHKPERSKTWKHRAKTTPMTNECRTTPIERSMRMGMDVDGFFSRNTHTVFLIDAF